MSRECHQYNFNHKERGFAVLIVNKNFPKDSGMIKRRGWKKDMTRMKTFFKSLQFQVKCYKDLKGGAIMQKVYKGELVGFITLTVQCNEHLKKKSLWRKKVRFTGV